MSESVNQAFRSATAMEEIAGKIAESSKAAVASVDAIRQQMRAYVSVSIGTAIYQDRAMGIKFQAIPTVVNAGFTPAHKLSFRASAAILPNPLPDNFDFPLPDNTGGASVLGPRQEITVSPSVEGACDDAEVESVKRGDRGKGLWTWGIFTYDDIFGVSHYTKFCHLYTWLPNGKTWGYYGPRHNEADR